MAGAKPLKIRILGDARDSQRSLRNSQTALGKFGVVARRMGAAGAQGIGLATTAGIRLAFSMDNARASIAEATGATGQTLKDQFDASVSYTHLTLPTILLV